MALLTRFSRLLSADLHAVLDRLEDPLVLLQQAQREMTTALAAQRERLAALEQQLKGLDRERDNGTARLSDLAAELDLCLDSNNDTLARSVIKRRLLLQARQERLQSELAAGREQHQQLTGAIERQQSDLETITAEAEHLARRERQLAAAPSSIATNAESITDEAIELALLAERRARGSAA